MKTTFAALLGCCAGILDLSSKTNLVVPWGQHLSEKPLREYCHKQDISTLVISSLDLRPMSRKSPLLNITHHCNTFFNGPRIDILHCPEVEEDIKYCQKQGKSVILSISSSVPTAHAAYRLATDIWNMFLGGQSSTRPFGSAILDGIDVPIKGDDEALNHVHHLLRKLQVYFKHSKSPYFVTSTVECSYEFDSHKALQKVYFDGVFVKFYNSWCEVQNYLDPKAWNWKAWARWARTKSINRNVKIFLGVEARQMSGNPGYASGNLLKYTLYDAASTSQFGGLMVSGETSIWDGTSEKLDYVNLLHRFVAAAARRASDTEPSVVASTIQNITRIY
ncbi:Chitinase 2 [Entomophthora muscae]|uniref:Chitinase 2 n=1 Tax=Entomophthora muscae TaxID=34485 RepID=A0ACC2RK68_9FUNG|nr:Chitinase 2 [Entomophthora muscae]